MALTSVFTSLNLPVANVAQSKAFFAGLGFAFNPQFPDNDTSAAFVLGDHLQVMLIDRTFFNTLTDKETVDTSRYAQMTIALAFESREQVDNIVHTAVSLGGKLHAEPEEHESMYHWGFVDLDGHLWAINCMDMDAAQGED